MVNAVMGYTSKGFHEGTIGLDRLILQYGKDANVFFGGGNTLQEFKLLTPGDYLNALENPRIYLFTGGGTVLKVIEEGEVGRLDTVRCLCDDDQDEDEFNHKEKVNEEKKQVLKENSPSSAKLPGCVDSNNCDCFDLNDVYPKQNF